MSIMRLNKKLTHTARCAAALAVAAGTTAHTHAQLGLPDPVQYTDSPLLAGYASERRLGEIGGTPSVIAERMKSGAVILMADNPVFRGTYPGTEKLLMNAIFFSGLIDRPRGDYGAEE